MTSHKIHQFSWVHCNKCFVSLLQRNQQLFLTNCMHIFCGPCIERGETTNAPRCPVCKILIKLQPINSQMSEQCKQLFHPRPWEIPKHWIEVAKFQKKQRKHITRALALSDAKLSQAEKMLTDLKNNVKMVIKKREELRRDRAMVEQQIQRFKEEYKRKQMMHKRF